MENFVSINPHTLEEIKQYPLHSEETQKKILVRARQAYQQNASLKVTERVAPILQLATLLEAQGNDLAHLLTLEMGKPLAQAKAEIEKCAWLCRYYAKHAPEFLAPRTEKTDAHESYVRYDPLGVVLAIMPWNFPFWQVVRCAVPAILAGNSVILKHAENVQGCAEALEKLFAEAGGVPRVLQNIRVSVKDIEKILAHQHVKAVSLTGSVSAGKSVAALAGKYLKPQILELGGSNAMVVFEDAPLEQVVDLAISARLMNNGQSCIAAKRFLLHQAIAENFTALLLEKLAAVPTGNPFTAETEVGPLARVDLAEKLEEQVQRALKAGATLQFGGKRQQAFYEPTVLTKVEPGNPAFKEELFGPVFSITVFKTEAEAVNLVNQSDFGLGVSLLTNNVARAKALIHQLEEGAVFINEMVKSHPHLPFGGTKNSGYGRELSREGARAFTNVKTVYQKNSL
jgi:succinate-semialdehyde dehydrogenase/glutarate-semialdehyde dehydrogenase